MPGNKKLQDEVLAVSEGVLETLVDFTLYLAFSFSTSDRLLVKRKWLGMGEVRLLVVADL